jgi:hypothetical protein
MVRKDAGVGLLKRTFGTDPSDKHNPALLAFHQLRKSVKAVCESPASPDGRRTLFNYYAQCCYAQSRFPSAPLSMTWFTSFPHGDPSSEKNMETAHGAAGFELERLSVLYNIACYESVLGVHTDRSKPTGSKDAAKRMAAAAGIFLHLKGEAERAAVRSVQLAQGAKRGKGSGPGRLSDMQPAALQALADVMVACAQVCFYEKGVLSKMSPKTLARLAMGTRDLFQKASPQMAVIDPKGNWPHKLRLQALCFEAAGHYWQAHVEKAQAEARGSGYGTEIARLNLAQAKVTEAEVLGKQHGLAEVLMVSCTSLADKIQAVMKVAVDSNNTVYMEMIPGAHELGPISPACVAKPFPFDPALLETGGVPAAEGGEKTVDLFKAIVPRSPRCRRRAACRRCGRRRRRAARRCCSSRATSTRSGPTWRRRRRRTRAAASSTARAGGACRRSSSRRSSSRRPRSTRRRCARPGRPTTSWSARCGSTGARSRVWGGRAPRSTRRCRTRIPRRRRPRARRSRPFRRSSCSSGPC